IFIASITCSFAASPRRQRYPSPAPITRITAAAAAIQRRVIVTTFALCRVAGATPPSESRDRFFPARALLSSSSHQSISVLPHHVLQAFPSAAPMSAEYGSLPYPPGSPSLQRSPSGLGLPDIAIPSPSAAIRAASRSTCATAPQEADRPERGASRAP